MSVRNRQYNLSHGDNNRSLKDHDLDVSGSKWVIRWRKWSL